MRVSELFSSWHARHFGRYSIVVNQFTLSACCVEIFLGASSCSHIPPYDLHYLHDFKTKRPKTWEQLEHDCWRTNKKHLQRMAREEQAALQHEEAEKARAVVRKARAARLEACNYQRTPSYNQDHTLRF
jgi:hypothetical protein